jgi:hypothetical protein
MRIMHLDNEGNGFMGEKEGKRSLVMVNRSPVLTLWEPVAAEVLGFEREETLIL